MALRTILLRLDIASNSLINANTGRKRGIISNHFASGNPASLDARARGVLGLIT